MKEMTEQASHQSIVCSLYLPLPAQLCQETVSSFTEWRLAIMKFAILGFKSVSVVHL